MSTAVIFAGIVALAAGKAYLKEEFNSMDNWVQSNWKKDDGTAGEMKLTSGKWYGDESADQGLQTSQDARFYAYSTKFEDFSSVGKDLVIQFSVKHEQKIDCGGGYMKIFPAGTTQDELQGGADESKYNIMFGPDICGTGTKKVHVIFEHGGKNHLTKQDIKCETDELTHVYTLVVKPDMSYQVLIDLKQVAEGQIEDDFDMLLPKQIKDPALSKPSDWVDEKKIDDPEDVKPDGHDDIPAQIADPEAAKPEDWDDEDDGEWEAPMIDNPDYKGEWKAKKIDNPDYKGPWEHPMIDNPDYKADNSLGQYKSFGVAAIEVWQVKAGSIFDNIFIGDSLDEAKEFAEATYSKTKDGEKKMYDDVQEEQRKKEEEERKKAEAEADAEADEEPEDEDDEDDESKAAERKEKLEKLKEKGKDEL